MPGLARRNPAPPPPFFSEMGAIAAGGALGALARHALGSASPIEGAAFGGAASLIVVLVINFVGAAALGSLTAVLETRAAHALWQPFLGTGFFGAFTTYSALILEIHRTADRQGAAPAGLYLLLSLGLGVVLYHWAEHRTQRRLEEETH